MSVTEVGLSVERLSGALGAEVRGVDLRAELERPMVRALRDLLNEHGVLCFRDQDMTDQEHLRFAKYFGPVAQPLVDWENSETPNVMVLDKMHGDRYTERFHVDQTYVENPPLGATLRATRVPSVGGDTVFSNMYLAYEALASEMQSFLRNLTAVHKPQFAPGLRDEPGVIIRFEEGQEAVHPVVRTHPETGRDLLFVCWPYTEKIVELGERESRAILDFLVEHVNSPQFHCRVRWEVGTVVLWDNRATQHCAVSDYFERRTLHRVSIEGDRPFGPAMPKCST